MDKLQRAGRAFLWYLVKRHGLEGAARAAGARRHAVGDVIIA